MSLSHVTGRCLAVESGARVHLDPRAALDGALPGRLAAADRAGGAAGGLDVVGLRHVRGAGAGRPRCYRLRPGDRDAGDHSSGFRPVHPGGPGPTRGSAIVARQVPGPDGAAVVRPGRSAAALGTPGSDGSAGAGHGGLHRRHRPGQRGHGLRATGAAGPRERLRVLRHRRAAAIATTLVLVVFVVLVPDVRAYLVLQTALPLLTMAWALLPPAAASTCGRSDPIRFCRTCDGLRRRDCP